MKLVTYGDPSSAQRGVRGSTIAFPQDNPLVNLTQLPHKLSELSGSLSIIFVGNQQPTEKQLEKIFKVNSVEILSVLEEWQANGHPGFQEHSWNLREIEAFEESGGSMTDFLRHCIHSVDERDEESLEAARQSYTNEVDDDDDVMADLSIPSEEEDIVLVRAGLVNSNNVAEDRDALTKSAVEALQVGHHDDPVSTYGNPEYWVNSMPWLFPFGSGGAEKERPAKLSIIEWIRHCLNFHDDRFRRDPAFLFVVYKTVQVRRRVSDTKILFKRMLGGNAVGVINQPCPNDFDKALEVLAKKKTLYGDSSDEVWKIKALHRNVKIIGGQNLDSIYCRDGCKNEMMGLVVYYGLPCIFCTINPSDISNPIVSFWHETGKEEFNLDTLLPRFPSQSARAKMVADDPVHGSEMFHTVITAFLEAFLGFEYGIGGHCEKLLGTLLNRTIFTGDQAGGLNAFFGTVECQNRGSLHLHLLIWLAGFPSVKDIVARINAALALARTKAGFPENPTCPPISPTSLDQTILDTSSDNVSTMDRSNMCSSASDPASVVPVDNNYVGSDYIHKNAIGDGRCSIHATADILGVDITEVCKEFRTYTVTEVSMIESLCSQPISSPEVQAYIAEQRLSPLSVAYSDRYLQERFIKELQDRKEGLQSACSNLESLFREGQWMNNDAAQGSSFFVEFVPWYFCTHRGIEAVRVCGIKVQTLSSVNGRLTHTEMIKLLTDANILINDSMLSAFQQHKLIVYVEVGESHWHSIIPCNLQHQSSPPIFPQDKGSSSSPVLAAAPSIPPRDQPHLSSHHRGASLSLPLDHAIRSFPNTVGVDCDVLDELSVRTQSNEGQNPSLDSADTTLDSDRMFIYDVNCPWLQPEWLSQVILCIVCLHICT